MNRRAVYEYKNDWIVDVNLCRKYYKTIETFSPIPNLDVLFDFKAWYEVISPSDEKRSLAVFRLKLEKLYSFNIKPSLECDVDVTVKYNTMYTNLPWHASTCTFHQYKTIPGIVVENMDCIHFENAVHKMYDGSDKSAHHKNMESNLLVLVCKLKFYFNLSLSEICQREISDPNTFIDDFKYFFKSSVLSDVVFKIGEQSIHAHKIVIAAHSPVFRTMLTQDFLESKTNCIEITDCAYNVYEHFLKYLYFRKIEDSSYQTVTQLHGLSDKYDVCSLKEDCARILMTYMSVDSICGILKSAYDFNNDKLKILATVFASVHFDELEFREDWKALVGSHPLIGYEVAKKCSPKA